MSYLRLNISERLTFSEHALVTVQNDPVLGQALARYGYAAEQIARGLEIEAAARRARAHQEAEFVNRLEASQTVLDLEKKLRKIIVADRNAVQAALHASPERYRQLRLHRTLIRNRPGFLDQARSMYLQIQKHPDVLAALGAFGFSPETLMARLEFVEAFATAMQRRTRQVAEARIATQKRQEAMDLLDRWMSDFIATARYALGDDKAQLKKLGLPIGRTVRARAVG